jgi:drug/metabolite transporter (DMT)-like permease
VAGGLVPFRTAIAPVQLAGQRVSWLVPALGLALVAAAFAYVIGMLGARLLGATLASFVGLSEVLFAVLFAWLFIGQAPTVLQGVGGVVVVAGVALVRLGELRAPAADRPALPVEEPVSV